jgi:hypothetical protein
MSEQKMTIKRFVNKATSGKVSAAAFLAAHRSFLLTGDLAPVTSPILIKLEKGELLPTPALEQVTKVVFDHMMAAEVAKAHQSIENSTAPSVSTEKPYQATIYNLDDSVATQDGKDLIHNAAMQQDAQGWCDRRLNESAPGSYAIIVANNLISPKSGLPLTFKVTRDEALGRLNAKKAGAVTKGENKSTGRLSFGIKAKNDHCHFSRG